MYCCCLSEKEHSPTTIGFNKRILILQFVRLNNYTYFPSFSFFNKSTDDF